MTLCLGISAMIPLTAEMAMTPLMVAGVNTLNGGAGHDYFVETTGRSLIDGGTGNDVIYGGGFADTASGGDGHDYIDGKSDNDSLTGGAGNDTILGAIGNDTMQGNDGDDFLFGQHNEDLLSSGAGKDTLVGGSGVDDYVITSASGATAVIRDFAYSSAKPSPCRRWGAI